MELKTALVLVHLAGTALGVGGATVSDLLFFRSIRDGKIEAKEFEFLQTVSNAVVLGLALAAISGIGFLALYYLEAPHLLRNPKLWAKMTIVAVIAINGLVMHRFVFPALRASVGEMVATSRLADAANLVITTGTVSSVSWYAALLLGAVRELNFATSYVAITGSYLLVLLAALSFAHALGRRYVGRLRKL